jgi:hypothetical protein
MPELNTTENQSNKIMLSSKPLEKAVESIITNSPLLNNVLQFRPFMTLKEASSLPEDQIFPLTMASANFVEWSSSKVIVDLDVIILIPFPDLANCESKVDQMWKARVAANNYVGYLFEIWEWLVGEKTLDNGKSLYSYNEEGLARVEIFWDDQLAEKYENSKHDLIWLVARMPLSGRFNNKAKRLSPSS